MPPYYRLQSKFNWGLAIAGPALAIRRDLSVSGVHAAAAAVAYPNDRSRGLRQVERERVVDRLVDDARG